MKALSILQPWASLIILGEKRFETRSWSTAHRGPLVIHSSAKLPAAARALCYGEPFKTALAPLLLPYNPGPPVKSGLEPQPFPWNLPLGSLLGVVEVVDCRQTNDVELVVDGPEPSFGDYRPSRWAWGLRVLQVFKQPVPWRGALGLWEVNDECCVEWFEREGRLQALAQSAGVGGHDVASRAHEQPGHHQSHADSDPALNESV